MLPPVSTPKRTPGDREAQGAGEPEVPRVRAGSGVFPLVLLGLAAVHVAVFVSVAVFFGRRLEELDSRQAVLQQDVEVAWLRLDVVFDGDAHLNSRWDVVTRRLGDSWRHSSSSSSAWSRWPDLANSADHTESHHRTPWRRQTRPLPDRWPAEQKKIIKQAVRAEVGAILKQFTDATFDLEAEAVRQDLRERIERWASSVTSDEAADRSKRQALAGHELGNIFTELAHKEEEIFAKYCSNSSILCLPGPKGQVGQPGVKGDTGQTGGPGVKGDLGQKGEIGVTGATGLKGDTGLQGPQGLRGADGQKGERGIDGQQGLKGDQGPQGVQGLKGEDGPQGLTGPAGPQGLQGDKGAPGSLGPKGELGDKGDVGAKGDIGQQGPVGQKGDQGARGVDGAEGAEGPRGPMGLSGPPGPKGTDGIAGLPGNKGVPGGKGEEGSPGPAGQQGAAGLKGEPGLRGDDGSVGPKGDQGDAGMNGPPGPKGDVGYSGPPGKIGQKGEPGDQVAALDTCCSHLSKPKFPDTASTTVVRAGDNLTLICGDVSYPPSTITWLSNGILARDPRYFVDQNNHLIITNVQLVDDGQITCTAANALGTADKTFVLRVPQPLIISQVPSNMTVIEGAKLTLECRFDNVPPPTITWYHVTQDGTRQPVTSGVTQAADGSSTLTKEPVQVSDRGSYVCVGNNGVETAEITDNVIVESKPYFTFTSGQVMRNAGDDLILRCKSDSMPRPSISWTHDRNDSHVFADVNGDLHILDLRPEDAGNYTCIATNKYGQTTSSVSVQVRVPPYVSMVPDVTPLQQNIFFNCQASGDDPLTVSWQKDGLPLDMASGRYIALPSSEGSHRLLVTSATDADVGVYSCVVNNPHGTVREQTLVYKDIGVVGCADSFGACAASLCGAHCPQACVSDMAGVVYGNGSYSEHSSICRSAIHSGVLGPAEAATMLWENTANHAPFPGGIVRHGVQSSGAANEPMSATPLKVDLSNP